MSRKVKIRRVRLIFAITTLKPRDSHTYAWNLKIYNYIHIFYPCEYYIYLATPCDKHFDAQRTEQVSNH